MLDVVYFSNIGGNTDRFVKKLSLTGTPVRIPIHGEFRGKVESPFVLVTPTYSAEDGVPPQVNNFLAKNSEQLIGVIGTGNLAFGDKAFKASKTIAKNYNVPDLYHVEINGTQEDVKAVEEGLQHMTTIVENETAAVETPEGVTSDLTENYVALNAEVNRFDKNGRIQFHKDKQAVRSYFLQHANQNMVFFHSLKEKLDYLVENNYYEAEFLSWYDFDFIKSLHQKAYAKKFRFETFVGAHKFYSSYALKTFDGKRYLERWEDRVCTAALFLAGGNKEQAEFLMDEMMAQRFQPATPTFLNAGKKQRGELVSCFLVNLQDNMESIGRSINSALQLSKRGGGVAFNLTDIRASGAPIKHIEDQSSGVIPIMKLYENSFSYANQLGARQGAGAVYLHAHHMDILNFLDTRKENADEKIRIKTLSLGVLIPDITLKLAEAGESMYLFDPYSVEKVYGRPMSEVNITEEYHKMVANPKLRKKKIDAAEFLQTIADIQFQSGYPYTIFIDNVNRANNIDGIIKMSNLCVEIFQVQEDSEMNEDLSYAKIGKDISCNLGSLNIANAIESPDFARTIEVSVRALTRVSDTSNITAVPTIDVGNKRSHAIGLGAMNLHGALAKNNIMYGSRAGLDFTNMYFYAVAFYAIKASMEIAKEKKAAGAAQFVFDGFERSKYATGEFFDKYVNRKWAPVTQEAATALRHVPLPTQADWEWLKAQVAEHGMYNQNLQAIPPTGSISYINNAVPSILPITAKVEIRKEGKMGRVYVPAPYMTDENQHLYKDAYELGNKAIIDTCAMAQQHVDQGISMTLFFDDAANTGDVNKAQVYSWNRKIKSIYYIRIRKIALEGTDVEGCVSCAV